MLVWIALRSDVSSSRRSAGLPAASSASAAKLNGRPSARSRAIAAALDVSVLCQASSLRAKAWLTAEMTAMTLNDAT